jgi:hypothetical protein
VRLFHLFESTFSPGTYIVGKSGLAAHYYEHSVSGMAFSFKKGDDLTLIRRGKHWPNSQFVKMFDGSAEKKLELLNKAHPNGPTTCWYVKAGGQTFMFPEKDLLALELRRATRVSDTGENYE